MVGGYADGVDDVDLEDHEDDDVTEAGEDLMPLSNDSLVQEVSSMAGHQLGTV